MNSPLLPILLLLNAVIAIALIVGLWRKPVSLTAKITWSIIICLPFAGAILYLAFANPAPPLPPHRRSGVHAYIAWRGKSGIDADHGLAPTETRNQRRARKSRRG